jgi:hypothetical protein
MAGMVRLEPENTSLISYCPALGYVEIAPARARAWARAWVSELTHPAAEDGGN